MRRGHLSRCGAPSESLDLRRPLFELDRDVLWPVDGLRDIRGQSKRRRHRSQLGQSLALALKVFPRKERDRVNGESSRVSDSSEIQARQHTLQVGNLFVKDNRLPRNLCSFSHVRSRPCDVAHVLSSCTRNPTPEGLDSRVLTLGHC